MDSLESLALNMSIDVAMLKSRMNGIRSLHKLSYWLVEITSVVRSQA